MPFQYFMPTQLVTGADCLVESGARLRSLGEKALIVTGARSAKENGSLNDAVRALEANGQRYAIFDKVMSNPTVQCAYDGAAAVAANGCDYILAIGGGSPMDAGKAIAALAAQNSPVPAEAVFSTVYTKALPIAAVPTTAGTGSEVTQYAILTNDLAETKTSIANPVLFPRIAYLDPKYMSGLKKAVTINTAIDALSHSVEGMLSNRASVISDCMAKESIRLIASCLPAIQEEPVSMEAREKLLIASTLGGMVIANTGTTAVHAMGYSLTYYKDIDHGRANGLLLPAFLAFTAKRDNARVAEILACMNMTELEEFAAALDSLLGKRETLTPEEVELYAEKAGKTGNIANCAVRPEKSDLSAMLNDSMR